MVKKKKVPSNQLELNLFGESNFKRKKPPLKKPVINNIIHSEFKKLYSELDV